MTDDLPTVVFVVATYQDVSAAEADFHAVGGVFQRLDGTETVDAVVLGKKLTGEARIYEGYAHPVATSRMATGLAVALFPAAQIGAFGWTSVEGAVTGALAGCISAGMSRDDLKELGDLLDRGEAAVVVAANPDMVNTVVGALARADTVSSRPARPNTAEVEREIAAIRSASEAL